jgi:3-oxoacyl-[acyl-carrier protein] reductase
MSSDRRVVITGAGRGIGRSIATAFAANGDHVFLVSRSQNELEHLASEIESAGGKAIVVQADVGLSSDVEHLFDVVSSRVGSVDVLVNSAGVLGAVGLGWEIDPEAWWEPIKINLFGTFLCCNAAMKLMTAQGSGSVINLSGGGATSPMERFSGYGVSKAGVVRLTETLAVEASLFGVRVNAISPGMVDTGIHDGVLDAGDKAGGQAEKVNLMRSESTGVSATETADLALWLASQDSEPLTGKLISAVHDQWREWGESDVRKLAEDSMLTLRRLDKFTLDSIDQSSLS